MNRTPYQGAGDGDVIAGLFNDLATLREAKGVKQGAEGEEKEEAHEGQEG